MPYACAPGLADVDGLGSKLKKVVKKVEQKVIRPVAKVAAVVGTAMYAPALLPVVAGKVMKPKAPAPEPVPVPEVQAAAPQVPTQVQAAMAPATVTAGAAPTAKSAALPQLMPQLLPQPAQPAQPQMFSPTITLSQPAQAQGEDTKKLLLYGGLGLGALMLLTMANRR